MLVSTQQSVVDVTNVGSESVVLGEMGFLETNQLPEFEQIVSTFALTMALGKCYSNGERLWETSKFD